MEFAQFTSMLINNVFDALISAHIRQTEAYIQLVEAVGQTPQNLIANTQNAISQEAITQFLAPLANITDGQNLIDADVIRINDALALPDDGRGHGEQQSGGSGRSGHCRGSGYTAGSRETIGCKQICHITGAGSAGHPSDCGRQRDNRDQANVFQLQVYVQHLQHVRPSTGRFPQADYDRVPGGWVGLPERRRVGNFGTGRRRRCRQGDGIFSAYDVGPGNQAGRVRKQDADIRPGKNPVQYRLHALEHLIDGP